MFKLAITMKYRHLFFDLDHTLWDFETNAKESLLDVYQSNALKARGIEDFDLFFDRYSFHNDKLWKRYTAGHLKQDILRWKRMWLALLDFKIADELLAKQMASQFLEILPFKKKLFPYTIEILDYLKSKNYKMHLITNGFEVVQHAKLNSCNIQPYFDKIITSELSNSLKPNKEIFEFALQAAKAAKHESIMIGDNPDADILGAINVGLDTIFVNHVGIEIPHKVTFAIRHLKELETIF